MLRKMSYIGLVLGLFCVNSGAVTETARAEKIKNGEVCRTEPGKIVIVKKHNYPGPSSALTEIARLLNQEVEYVDVYPPSNLETVLKTASILFINEASLDAGGGIEIDHLADANKTVLEDFMMKGGILLVGGTRLANFLYKLMNVVAMGRQVDARPQYTVVDDYHPITKGVPKYYSVFPQTYDYYKTDDPSVEKLLTVYDFPQNPPIGSIVGDPLEGAIVLTKKIGFGRVVLLGQENFFITDSYFLRILINILSLC